MDDLPLISLRALAAVHAHQGVRAAATELGIAHSSVSRHLAELEKWLGLVLVERANSPRGFALTPEGVKLAEVALAAMQAMDEAAAAIREARHEHSVVIATAPSFAARWLLPRLSSFGSRQRGIEISVLSEQRVVDVSGGSIDLAIRMGRGPWSGLHCEPLMDDALYPVVSPDLLAQTGRPSTARQWRNWQLLHDRDPYASWAVWKTSYGPQGLDVKRGPRFTSSDLVLQAAKLSQGAALARHRMAADDIAVGSLVRPFEAQSAVLPDAYWIVMPSRSQRRPEVMQVVSWLIRQAAACGSVV
jgi:LysR family transcriptional regulator, glycine cleavage system transcriptional activator